VALGNVAIWGALGRATTRGHLRILSSVAFPLDAFIVFTFIWIFAYQTPYVMWAVILLLPMEGALRYRLKGALMAAAVCALFLVAQTIRVGEVNGSGEFEWNTYIFIAGLAFLVAGVVGAMAENWYEQSVALKSQSLQLAEVDELKDRFLAITSHEIRGPLTAIIAGVDTVQKRNDRLTPEQRDRLLEMVAAQGQQLARLVDDLLVTAQMQNGAPALHPQWVALPEVFDGAIGAASPKRRGHQLEIFVDQLKCEIDAARVSQIVRNLLENAYKYTSEKTAVSVSAKKASSGITIAIADTGDGIPLENRERLFEAFARGDGTKAGQEGVGLGLYVVSQLVSTMDGHIDLASSSNGTTFTISIPCQTRSQAPKLGLVPEDGTSTA
jgi:signal transduction histidine kinase